jgi:pSer/pThr/pTyr-binding forkhead associated (FHA) protein
VSKNAISFHIAPAYQQKDEKIRLKILSGADYGRVYLIVGSPVSLGRAEDCDVILSDVKASRHHAQLVFRSSSWFLRDLDSANGVVFKEKKISEEKIEVGEEFVIGDTHFELFNPFSSAKRNLVQALEKKKKSSSLPFLIFGVVIIVLFLSGSDQVQSQKKERVLDLPTEQVVLEKEPQRSKNEIQQAFVLKDGLREYYSGNYARARSQFAAVLQVYPHHEVATLYFEKANKAITDSVEYHIDYGKKTFQAGKLRAAKGHFQSVLRLLKSMPSDEHIAIAQEYLNKINEKAASAL